MHRQQLLSLLSDYQQRWPEESVTKRFIHFVEDHEDCFERSLKIGHVTASAWVVNEQQDSVVLMHHRKLDRWLQPGGHADGETDVLQVALKETLEETGLRAEPYRREVFDLDIHPIPARGDDPEHEHFDVRFLLIADDRDTIEVNEESHGVQWFGLDEIGEPEFDHSVSRMAEKLRSMRR